MLLSPILNLHLRPTLNCWVKQYRNTRPNIKIGKTKFQLELDVKSFNKNEIQVKARPEYVIIEGKKEQKTKRGYIMRQFMRKFKLPSGCITECMESKLSNDGILTVTAPRKICDESLPCETLIPVSQHALTKEEGIIPSPKTPPDTKNPPSDIKNPPPSAKSPSSKCKKT